MLKCFMQADEPLAWSGGKLAIIHKNKGGKDCAASRGVFVEHQFAKVLHKVARELLVPKMEAYALDSQCGGIAHRGADVATLRLILLQEILLYKRKSFASLLLDLRAAFDSVRRDLLFRSTTARRATLEKAGVDRALIKALEQFHHHTWFELTGSTKACMFDGGVKQGDPLGDIMFNMAMGDLMRDLTAAWRETGLMIEMTHNDGQPVFSKAQADGTTTEVNETSYMDDVVAAICPEKADQLIAHVARATEIATGVYEWFGLELNFEKGKSAAILRCCGEGSREQRRILAHDLKYSIPCSFEGRVFHLEAVHMYKHLGRVITSTGSFGPEAANRAGDLWANLRKSEKRVYRCAQVPVAKRVSVPVLLVVSRVLYQAGTWTHISKSEESILLRPIVRIVKDDRRV